MEEGVLLARVHVPELYVSKCLQFPKDQLVWDVKQQCLASLPKVSPPPPPSSPLRVTDFSRESLDASMIFG